MRKFLVPFLGVALVLVALPACSRTTATQAASPAAGQLPVTAQAAAPAKTPKKIAVVQGKSKRATELIAFVDVKDDKTHKDRALEALRAKAATLGADAIVGIEYHEGKNEPGHYSGAAVKYKKGSGHRANSATRVLREETPQPRSAKDPGPSLRDR